MKHCPTCHQTYTDETLKFCRVDGAILISDSLPADESSATRVFPTSDTSQPQPTASQVATSESAPITGELKSTGAIPRPSLRKRMLVGVPVVILIVAVVSYFYFARGAASINSIAVLPFVNASGDPNAEFLSDGITESIINSLSQLPNLGVIARSSVFRYKGKDADASAVGRELNVRSVLTGRVAQRGDNLSISVELVDASNNHQLWGQQYNRKAADVLATQEEIAKEITERLRVHLSGEQQKRLTRRYTDNAEAYQLYLKGRYHFTKYTADEMNRGIDFFNQAINLDPNYALAYAGLAEAYAVSPYVYLSPKDAFPKAREAATKALLLDETLAEAHNSLAIVSMLYDRNWSMADKEFKRALELNPGSAWVRDWHGVYLEYVGRVAEGQAELKRAQEFDPLSLPINADYGNSLFYARQYEQAIEQFRKTLDLDQDYLPALGYLGWAYEQKGQYEQAIELFQKERRIDDSAIALGALGHAYAWAGKRAETQKVLDELMERSKRGYVSPDFVGFVYIGLGEKDDAFKWLEKAYNDRTVFLAGLKVEPIFDPLRSDARFNDLLRRVGLAP